MKKQTPEQIERALKKLASKVAWANYPIWPRENKNQEQALWNVFRQSFKVLVKTGAIKYYEAEMDKLNKQFHPSKPKDSGGEG